MEFLLGGLHHLCLHILWFCRRSKKELPRVFLMVNPTSSITEPSLLRKEDARPPRHHSPDFPSSPPSILLPTYFPPPNATYPILIHHEPSSIRIIFAGSVGLPASSLCINRRLYQIASAQSAGFGRTEKIRAMLIDTLICVVFPLVFVACQYIVQGHRFNIFEDVGCYPAVYNTLVTYFISSIWPIVIGLISATYCVLSLRIFARRRLEFSRFMNSTSSFLTMGCYFRLMALAMSDVLLTTPLAIFTIWLNLNVSPVKPWISWEDTHFNYSHILQIPASVWRSNHVLVMIMDFTRWVSPLCGFVFFAFFGFADEARRNYRMLFTWLTRPLHLGQWKRLRSVKGTSSTWQFNIPKTPMSSSSSPPSILLPTYSPPPNATYPILDIKRSTFLTPSTTTNHHHHHHAHLEELRDSFTEKASEETSTTVLSPGQDSNNRFSWKSISVPFSGRRYSSYF